MEKIICIVSESIVLITAIEVSFSMWSVLTCLQVLSQGAGDSLICLPVQTDLISFTDLKFTLCYWGTAVV